MDALKLFTKDSNELKDLLNVLKCFIDDISIDFRLNKYENVTFSKGGFIETYLIALDFSQRLKTRISL